MIFDPVANMISAIKNGYKAKKAFVEVPHSRYKEEIAKALEREKFVGKVESKSVTETGHKKISIKLVYHDKKPVLTEIKQVSKPSRRIYVSHSKVPVVLGGLGFSVISTPQGVMSTKEIKKKHLGGEIICHVW